METSLNADKVLKEEIWHKDFNLEGRDNLTGLPEEKAVFGIFAIMNNEPANCRYVAATENLQKAITGLYEKPVNEGLGKFLQGPWIKILQYQLMVDHSEEEMQKMMEEWMAVYNPKIDPDGECPGYYE